MPGECERHGVGLGFGGDRSRAGFGGHRTQEGSVGTGEEGWFPRGMTQYLCTRDANLLLCTQHMGYGQMVKVDSDWENWKTRYDLRT